MRARPSRRQPAPPCAQVGVTCPPRLLYLWDVYRVELHLPLSSRVSRPQVLSILCRLQHLSLSQAAGELESEAES